VSPLECTKLVYNDAMPTTKHVRRSVSLPTPIAKQVERMAKSQRLSDNRILVELIELGIEARKQKEEAFFELAERFRAASDPQQAKRLGEELGRFVFGEEEAYERARSQAALLLDQGFHLGGVIRTNRDEWHER
jgi:hypothetical protein